MWLLFPASRTLPPEAQRDVLRRAKLRVSAFADAESVDWADFCAWMDDASDADLIEIGPPLVARGAAWSFGKTRADGHVPDPHVEPLTLGRFRNLRRPDVEGFKPPSQPKGGRPAAAAVDQLMTDLGLLWLEATSEGPEAVRGHKTPFAQVAERALEEAGVTAASTAIRRFFRAMKMHRERKSEAPLA